MLLMLMRQRLHVYSISDSIYGCRKLTLSGAHLISKQLQSLLIFVFILDNDFPNWLDQGTMYHLRLDDDDEATAIPFVTGGLELCWCIKPGGSLNA